MTKETFKYLNSKKVPMMRNTKTGEFFKIKLTKKANGQWFANNKRICLNMAFQLIKENMVEGV